MPAGSDIFDQTAQLGGRAVFGMTVQLGGLTVSGCAISRRASSPTVPRGRKGMRVCGKSASSGGMVAMAAEARAAWRSNGITSRVAAEQAIDDQHLVVNAQISQFKTGAVGLTQGSGVGRQPE
jgi:hypothetical protein